VGGSGLKRDVKIRRTTGTIGAADIGTKGNKTPKYLKNGGTEDSGREREKAGGGKQAIWRPQVVPMMEGDSWEWGQRPA